MPDFSDLDRAVHAFAESANRVERVFEPASVAAHRRQSFGAVRSTVVSDAFVFREAYSEAGPLLRQAMTPPEELGEDSTADEMRAAFEVITGPAMIKTVAAIRGLVFSVRAYQDAIYRLFLETRGESPGGGSMSTGIKPSSPMRQLLDARCPGYVEWFPGWRKLRDRIKAGRQFIPISLRGDEIRFTELDASERGFDVRLAPYDRMSFGAREVVEALEWSACVTDAVDADYLQRTSGS